MTTLTPTPKQQFLDANGNPLSGGKVYTYAAGTTTPLTTYTDESGTTPNTNPVILDSRGEAGIWLGVASYKLKLTTATDVEIWTVDNIVSASVQALADLSESGGSALVGFLQAGTGAVATTVQAKLRETVSVLDFGAVGDGVADDTAAVQAAVSSGAAIVVVPASKNVKVVSEITVPASVNLTVNGEISGAGRLTFAGSTYLSGTGKITCGNIWSVRLSAGDCVVDGLFIGKASTHGILILPTAQVDSLRITNNRIKGSQYGVLRNPNSTFACFDVLISNNTIEDVTGDGIEWNVAPYDRRIAISNNIVKNVNGGIANSGIGIGVAGSAYTNTNDLANYVQNVSITDNQITGARQGIHTEAVAKCKISGNTISDITSSYGSSSIVVRAIICYAPVETQVSDNYIFDCDSGVTLDFGVVSATYTGSPFNCIVENNMLSNAGGIGVYAGQYTTVTAKNVMTIKANHVLNGSLALSGTCYWVIDSNSTYPSAGQTGFALDFNNAARGASYQTSNQYVLRITNNQTFDVLSRVNASLTNMTANGGYDGNISVYAQNNAFAVIASDTADRNINKTVYSTEAGLSGVPYGIEYQAGTLVIDTATPARYLVTVSGSRNRATDTYTVTDAANGIIQSSNYAWTNAAHHQVGQAITLTDGVISPVACYVRRVYVSGGQYRMDVVNAAGTALALGTLGSGTITATNALTAVTV